MFLCLGTQERAHQMHWERWADWLKSIVNALDTTRTPLLSCSFSSFLILLLKHNNQLSMCKYSEFYRWQNKKNLTLCIKSAQIHTRLYLPKKKKNSPLLSIHSLLSVTHFLRKQIFFLKFISESECFLIPIATCPHCILLLSPLPYAVVVVQSQESSELPLKSSHCKYYGLILQFYSIWMFKATFFYA